MSWNWVSSHQQHICWIIKLSLNCESFSIRSQRVKSFQLSADWIRSPCKWNYRSSENYLRKFLLNLVDNIVKVLSRIISHSRQSRRNDGYVAANTSVTTDVPVDDVFQPPPDDLESKMSLPPRYRFRDLLLGDFAFTDDGQRWVTSIVFCYASFGHVYSWIISFIVSTAALRKLAASQLFV